MSKKVKDWFLSNSLSSILVLSFDKEDYNDKNLEDEDSIVVDYDEVSFTLGIAIDRS